MIYQFCIRRFTDDMRNNFRLMKACSEHTRLGPRDRMQRLLQFNRRIATTPASLEVLDEFKMVLDKNLVDVNGRLLDPEPIVFGNNGQ